MKYVSLFIIVSLLLGSSQPGNLHICETMLRKGLAWYNIAEAQSPDLHKLEQETKTSKVGLWAEEKPVPPWHWREGARSK